ALHRRHRNPARRRTGRQPATLDRHPHRRTGPEQGRDRSRLPVPHQWYSGVRQGREPNPVRQLRPARHRCVHGEDHGRREGGKHEHGPHLGRRH
ncbi:hypothetical protein LTR94_036692, partial [Friedmanniomyces endolithicus]